MTVTRLTFLLLGAVLIGLGLIWTLQGVGVLGGSPMTGEVRWAVIGPIVALGGLLLLARARRQPR